jgi:hypothetical protein
MYIVHIRPASSARISSSKVPILDPIYKCTHTHTHIHTHTNKRKHTLANDELMQHEDTVLSMETEKEREKEREREREIEREILCLSL